MFSLLKKPANSVKLSLLLLAVIGSLGLSGCNEKKVDKVEKLQRPVVVETVRFEPKSAARSFVGTVRPRVESDLGFRVAGKVDKRLVQAGDRVKAGQEMAQLDATDLRLQREQSSAELKAALSSQIQANAAYQRGQSLRKQGWSTAADLDRLKAASDEADGRVNRDQQALTLATNALGYAVLLADADGVVTQTMIEPGQVIAAGTPAIRVAQNGEREVVAAIPEALVDRVAGAKATVSLWSQTERSYTAKLRELSPTADSSTRTYPAKFTILDAGPQVEFGMTATLILSDPDTAQVARLPLSSLFNEGKGPSLWVVDPKTGILVLKPVDIAGYDARDVLIKSGVEAGEQIVTLGVQKLDAGQKVRVVTNIF